jgi:hypothetical protein
LTWVLSNVSLDVLCSHVLEFQVLPSPQGLLLVAILGGGDASSTFGSDTAITRTKGYLIFILSFTAMTNSIVGSFSLRFD